MEEKADQHQTIFCLSLHCSADAPPANSASLVYCSTCRWRSACRHFREFYSRQIIMYKEQCGNARAHRSAGSRANEQVTKILFTAFEQAERCKEHAAKCRSSTSNMHNWFPGVYCQESLKVEIIFAQYNSCLWLISCTLYVLVCFFAFVLRRWRAMLLAALPGNLSAHYNRQQYQSSNQPNRWMVSNIDSTHIGH